MSVDAIMNMTNDGNVIAEEDDPPIATDQNVSSPAQNIQPSTPNAQRFQPTISYASAAQPAVPNTGAIPKKHQKQIQHIQGFWTNQIKEIITNHNQGNRILILMRGVPGSGKSHLAHQIVDMVIGTEPIHHKTHILSTDDYFMIRGQYQYEKYKLPEAHSWNQTRVRNAITMGLSPIIVDNTNIEMWEMEPYLKDGVKNGYIIEVVEPKTSWAKKANQLVRKNTHNVPLANIKRMLDNYRDGITGASLINAYGLSYPGNMVPPVKRSVPPIIKEESPKPATADGNHTTNKPMNATHTQQNAEKKFSVEVNEEDKNTFLDENFDFIQEEEEKMKLFLEAQKKLEEIEQVEKEWENGDHWDIDDQGAAASIAGAAHSTASSKTSATATITTSVPEAKPPRKPVNASPPASTSYESAESLMQTVNDCQDWSKISMFMPPWVDSSEQINSVAHQEVPVETMSSGTCMEIGDTNVNGNHKVITATPRNINKFYISFEREKIPQKRMLDKSSMTHEGIITEAHRCSNEEKHFTAFRKLFKNIARSDLRDIFDKCCGDVNWSVEIVLDGMSNNQFKTLDTEDLSDPEEESIEQCECLAKYNIIPDVATPEIPITVIDTPMENKMPVAASGLQSQKKKRDVAMSDETIQIKRQIEQNVVIGDDHYSKHCLKIRKIRRGEDLSDMNYEEPGTSAMSAEASPFIPLHLDISDEEDGFSISDTDEDVIVNVNLGNSFISELDEMFGRNDMQYPEYVVPRISLPLSMLNEINALWMESLTFQLDEHAKQTAAMMQQDEEFARQIAMKEAELSLAGKEPAVPDFKEIMDMDMALAVYQKDVAEWRNSMPTDMAAKMTRDKLYNLFPDVDKDTLTELLMAHDNNFKSTVEVLLMSTGRSDVLEQENGINKFVMTEEMKLKDKIIKEQKKELSETEWPLLSKGTKVDLATVAAYRDQADQHLARRNLNQQKAQDYIRRGMTQVASYYSDIANFHKQKYEHANGLAVASLMQFHALNNPDCTTIDLHYLRVKEAKESLDVFIDTHVSKLRDAGVRRKQKLFFITGRGSHSQGRAKIKPATMQRLKERGLGYAVKNPGLLAAKVNGNTKLTYQVSVP